MILRALTKHRLEFLSLKEATQARLSLHLSKCHIAVKHMSRLISNFDNTNGCSLPCRKRQHEESRMLRDLTISH